MKRLLLLLAVGLMLSGCGAQMTWETVEDNLDTPVMAPKAIAVELPPEAEAAAMGTGESRLFLCDEYEIAVETMASGNLDETLKAMTGFGQEALTLVKTKQGDCSRYDFVWAGCSDQGEFTGRGSILDDGRYQYCLSLMRPVDKLENSQVVWSQVFSSFDVQ